MSATVSWTGTPGHRRRRRGRGPAARRRRRGALGAGLHARARRPLLLPPRRPDRPVRRGRRAERRRERRRDRVAARRARGRGSRRCTPASSGPGGGRAHRRGRRSSSSPSSSRPPTSTCSPTSASRHIGENRDQEASAKVRRRCAHRDRLTRALHRAAAEQQGRRRSRGYADVVQSVDRAKLVQALDRAAHAGRPPCSTCTCRSPSTSVTRARGGVAARGGAGARRPGRRVADARRCAA